jgi:hypothetical protein
VAWAEIFRVETVGSRRWSVQSMKNGGTGREKKIMPSAWVKTKQEVREGARWNETKPGTRGPTSRCLHTISLHGREIDDQITCAVRRWGKNVLNQTARGSTRLERMTLSG